VAEVVGDLPSGQSGLIERSGLEEKIEELAKR
jgi:hypothetical protein